MFKKTLLAVCILATSVVGLASTGDTQSILVDGSRPQEMVSLRGEVTHTEYRYEDRPYTCWRREFIGYQRVCRQVPVQRCYVDPRGNRTCQTYYETQCWNEPMYRDVPETCYEHVRIPYEVHDYNTLANVTVHVGATPQGASLHELVNVNLQGDVVTLSSARSSGQVFVYQRMETSANMSGSVKEITVNAYLRFLNRSQVLSPLSGGMQGLASANDQVTFHIGSSGAGATFGVKLIVKQKKAFGDKTLLDRVLNPGEYTAQVQNGRTYVSVDLTKLGIKMEGGKKHSVFAESFVNLSTENLVNTQDVPSLKVSQEITFRR